MNYLHIAKQSITEERKALQFLTEQLDENFNLVVEEILQCQGRLVIAGIGKSGLVGKKMVATFASTGTPSFFLHPTEAFHGDLGMLKAEDLVMLISYSGETDDVNKLIPSLKSFGNKIIAVTGNVHSSMAKNADYVLSIKIEREVCPNNLAPTSSVIVTMALGDALAVCLMNARHFQPEDFAKYHPGGNLGRRLLCRVKDVMRTTHLPIIAPETSLTQCLEVVSKGRMGVAIIMQQDTLLGIITDGDIRRLFAEKGADSLSVKAKDFMTKNPKTISQQAFIYDAESYMKEHKIHLLIAVDEHNRVVGTVEYTS